MSISETRRKLPCTHRRAILIFYHRPFASSRCPSRGKTYVSLPPHVTRANEGHVTRVRPEIDYMQLL